MTRIRVTGGPWPERIGCTGTIVPQPPGRVVYPWAGRSRAEFVILLDDDPLECGKRGCTHDEATYLSCTRTSGSHPWSCVISSSDVEPA